MNENSLNDAVTMRAGASHVIGTIDQYELKCELGGGGFGCVYLARDTVAGIDVAVKGLPPLVRHNKEGLENIRRNFALVPRLHHPNIAAALTLHPVAKAVYGNNADAEKLRVFEGDTLVVMQYAPGVTLSQWRKQFPDSKVPFGKALEIVRQIASALDYAHQEKILQIADKVVVIAAGEVEKIGSREEILPTLLYTAGACKTLADKQ
jgi:serine/threonine protein kinase